MAIVGTQIHSFQYVDYRLEKVPISIIEFLSKRIEDIESKHVANCKESTRIFFELSEKVGYPNTILGIHRNSNIQNEYFRIQNMSQSLCNRAVRFVISKDGRIWSDNTHWTLAYLLQKGANSLVSDIPAYMIDFRKTVPIVFDREGVVFDSIYDIKSSIASAKRIQERLDSGCRPTKYSYTIKQLHCDILSVIRGQD